MGQVVFKNLFLSLCIFPPFLSWFLTHRTDVRSVRVACLALFSFVSKKTATDSKGVEKSKGSKKELEGWVETLFPRRIESLAEARDHKNHFSSFLQFLKQSNSSAIWLKKIPQGIHEKYVSSLCAYPTAKFSELISLNHPLLSTVHINNLK